MTKQVKHCAWCGGAIETAGSVGRPRLYCRRSHRQRAFEARRLGAARGLAAGEAVVPLSGLRALADAHYILEAALEDGRDDLAGNRSVAEASAAFESLAVAAEVVLAAGLEPTATGDEPS